MPSNAAYLYAALAVTVLSIAAYVVYALARLRQAHDELRDTLQQADANRDAAAGPRQKPAPNAPVER